MDERCWSCGEEIHQQDRFCRSCGAELVGEAGLTDDGFLAVWVKDAAYHWQLLWYTWPFIIGVAMGVGLLIRLSSYSISPLIWLFLVPTIMLVFPAALNFVIYRRYLRPATVGERREQEKEIQEMHNEVVEEALQDASQDEESEQT